VSLQAFYVAATLAGLVYYLRLREPRLLPLLALFAFQAVAHFQGDWFAARPWHLAAGTAGLVQLVVIGRRPSGR
jgi:hypothetical protein